MMMMNSIGGFSKFLLRDRNLVGNARVVVNRLVQNHGSALSAIQKFGKLYLCCCCCYCQWCSSPWCCCFNLLLMIKMSFFLAMFGWEGRITILRINFQLFAKSRNME